MRLRALAALLLLAGCPPARVPPRATLQPGTSFEAALAEGEAAFASRPEVEAVRRGVRAFEQAGLAAPERVEGLIGVIRASAWLIEHGAREDRKALVEGAVAAGEQCQARAPKTAACDYWQAVALGLAAREQPLTALGRLPGIIELLRRADAAAPGLDDAGPSRVLALLLARAPGWPTGPGNVDDALVAAQAAVARAPKHPLNELALGECLAGTGDEAGARAAYERARDLGRARGDADGTEWAAQADVALQKVAR